MNVWGYPINAMEGTFLARWSHLTLSALVAGVLLGAVSCGHPHHSETSEKAPSPPSQIKDPIISMMMASSIDDKGQLVNPRFSFPQTEKQITATVQLGNIKGSQLTVTWYQTSDEGDEKLFEHQIQVKSRDRAFSVAKNPGGFFSADTYKVVATIDGQTKDTEFDIIPPKPAQNKTSTNRDERHFADQAELKNKRTLSVETNSDGLLQAISYDSVSDQSQVRKVATSSGKTPAAPSGSTAAQGKPPVSGQSGTVAQPPKPPSGQTASGCDVTVESQRAEGPDLDGGADTVDVISAGVCSEQRSIQVYASVAGAPQYVGGYDTGVAGNYAIFAVSPCWLTGGSDLPGTKVTVKAIAVDSSLKELASASRVITLGDDTLAPRVNVVSTPKRGSKVKTGDKINLKVTATEKRSGGPWQTGVKIIQVTAQPGGLVDKPWVNPSALPKACAEKTWEQEYKVVYTVPSNPPPIITICAYAEDYAGNESHQCGEFLTGDKWEGTMHSKTTAVTKSPWGTVTCADEGWDFDLHLVGGGDGAVAGKATSHLASMAQCTGPAINTPNYPNYQRDHQAKNATWNVSGKFDGREFKLQFAETYIDGSTFGLIQVSLGQIGSLVVNTIIVPKTSATTAQGETKTNVPQPYSYAGSVAIGDHIVTLKCTTCK